MTSTQLVSLREQISEISEFSASVPEPFQQKCFELLMTRLLETNDRAQAPAVAGASGDGGFKRSRPATTFSGGRVPMTSLLAAFVKNIGLPVEKFHRVVGYANGSVRFLREPAAAKSVQSQIEWALLLALKNAIVKGSFIVDAEEVKQHCQERGIFDRRNFFPHFRRHADFFRHAPEPAGKPQPLSSKGIAALSGLVRALAEKS